MPNVRTGIIQGVSKWYTAKSKLWEIELFDDGNEDAARQFGRLKPAAHRQRCL